MVEVSWPDEQLVAAARDGDVESLAALVSGSHPHVQRFAHSLCRSPEDAEDAAQEALIVLYRKIGTLRASRALASWMFRIIRNECIRRSRLIRRDRERLTEHATTTVASLEDEVLQRLEAGQVARAIADLPSEQRRVLIMRDVQGYSGRTVADMLGLSVAAMKSRLHRARAYVRDTLATPGGEDG